MRGRTDQRLIRGETTLCIIGGVVAGLVLLWHFTLWLTGDGLAITDLLVTIHALASGNPLGGLGESAPTPVVLAVFGTSLAIVTAICGGAVRLLGIGRRPRGLARGSQVRAQVGVEQARATAVFTRPDKFGDARALRRADVREFGWLMGTHHGSRQPVVVSHDDSVGVIAPSGSGKSRRMVIPASLDAIGPLVVTSTRADVLDVIAEPAARRGTLWVFDPLDSIGWPESMTWDPVRGCESGETALGRGEAFVGGMATENDGSTNAAFFKATASVAIQTLMHAAALDGKHIDSVLEWAISLSTADDPRQVLQGSSRAERLWHDLLLSVATGAEETVSSTRTTLTNNLRPLLLRKVLETMIPRRGTREFHAADFVHSTDTLVLISDSNAAANVAPLTTMLLDDVMDAGKAAGRNSPNGRLDPPLRIVGDEIANVAPLPKLPSYASDSRALGIQIMWAMQSMSQAESRWGKLGARTLLSNTSIKLVLGGLSDIDGLEETSRLLGDVQVNEIQYSYQGERLFAPPSKTLSKHDRRILRPEEIRQLPAGQALALYRNAPGVLVDLPSWDQRPDAADLKSGERTTRARRTARIGVSHDVRH